LKTLF